MQNEYPPKAHRKIVTLPLSPILTRLEIQMYKFTKRIPILTHLENSNALITKRIERILLIESLASTRFTHELNS